MEINRYYIIRHGFEGISQPRATLKINASLHAAFFFSITYFDRVIFDLCTRQQGLFPCIDNNQIRAIIAAEQQAKQKQFQESKVYDDTL